MVTRRELESYSEAELFNTLGDSGVDSQNHQAAAAEIERRRLHMESRIGAAQIAAAEAQVNAASDAAASLKAVRASVFWTAVAAMATAVAAVVSVWTAIRG